MKKIPKMQQEEVWRITRRTWPIRAHAPPCKKGKASLPMNRLFFKPEYGSETQSTGAHSKCTVPNPMPEK